MNDTLESSVADHYSMGGLLEAIEAGLRQAGADPAHPTVEQLSPVDEFHTAGRNATLVALPMMKLKPAMHVLDAGCGIGGTARHLAAEHGCKVTGIDLTPEYVDIARELTARTGLSDQCDFLVGSVVDLPMPDNTFDAAVTFHVAMNIENRPRFYGEVARVLKSGAEFCLFDVMKGPTPGMDYPAPWAETAETSFLKTRAETVDLLANAGFEVTTEKNMREFANDYFEKLMARAAEADGPPPLGLHLLTGANTQEKFANIIEAYKVHQTEPVILVATKR